MPKSVLFICLGNICRSPIAEAIFRHFVEEKKLQGDWHIDGAALGSWHVGNPPYEKALQVLKEHGVKTDHRVRVITKKDFTTFDTIFGMDEENMKELNRLKPKDSTAKLEMLGTYDPQGELIIEDPYWNDDYKDFQHVYDQCVRCCKAFLEKNI